MRVTKAVPAPTTAGPCCASKIVVAMIFRSADQKLKLVFQCCIVIGAQCVYAGYEGGSGANHGGTLLCVKDRGGDDLPALLNSFEDQKIIRGGGLAAIWSRDHAGDGAGAIAVHNVGSRTRHVPDCSFSGCRSRQRLVVDAGSPEVSQPIQILRLESHREIHIIVHYNP